jgi:hypothetical protein
MVVKINNKPIRVKEDEKRTSIWVYLSDDSYRVWTYFLVNLDGI